MRDEQIKTICSTIHSISYYNSCLIRMIEDEMEIRISEKDKERDPNEFC